MTINYQKIMDLISLINTLIKKNNNLEAQEKITELREAVLNLQNENQKLQYKIQEFENKSAILDNLVWEPPVYWREENGKRDGPYCQPCWDGDKKLIRLQDDSNYAFHCRICKQAFDKPNSNRPEFGGSGIADPEAGY